MVHEDILPIRRLDGFRNPVDWWTVAASPSMSYADVGSVVDSPYKAVNSGVLSRLLLRGQKLAHLSVGVPSGLGATWSPSYWRVTRSVDGTWLGAAMLG